MLKETAISGLVRRRFAGKGPSPVSAALTFALLAAAQAGAQETGEGNAATATEASPAAPARVQEVVVTGSRFGNRIISDSPTPIDVITAGELARGGQLQLQHALKTLVPSFSVSTPATAAALDFTSAPTLRGLGPGELLLMVNGKRRHSSGMLNTANQVGRGDVAYDFATIPTAAIGRVEVLRDGASAQYGADAIAGVINIVLDKSLGGSASLMAGASGEGDGEVAEFNGSVGVPLGGDGVVRASVRLQERKISNRASPDTRQQYFGSNGTRAISGNYGSGTGLTPASGTLDPREATVERNTSWLGEAPFTSGALFVNASKPLAGGASLYAFGGYSKVDGDSQGFFRRAGQDETVRALHPDGFRPVLAVVLENSSLAVGGRGQDLLGFGWDLSTAYGESKVANGRSNSNNVSLGAASPDSDYSGGSRFGQWTTNVDLTREFDAGGAALKLASGLEYRKEYYNLKAGLPLSYQNGGIPILDGPNKGKPAPVGFQPSPGVSPQDATRQQRDSMAVYGELERDFGERLMLSGAARYEHFSDFGSSSTYKLATRYRLSQPLSLRGSFSTGFRAPNLVQSFASTSGTIFVSGVPVMQRLLPTNNPVARLIGATDLRPEESRNLSLGAVYDSEGLSVSGDIYRIAIDDRLALSSMFQDTRLTALLASKGYPGVGAASYMTNAIDTVTRGVDLTASYRLPAGRYGKLTLTAAANYNRTDIGRIAGTPEPLRALGIVTPLFDTTQQVRLTSSAPKDKEVLGLNWKYHGFTANLNTTRYGEVKTVAFTSLTPAQIAVLTKGYQVELRPTEIASANSQVVQVFGAEFVSDLALSYSAGRTTFTLGVNNLFDRYPDKNIASTVESVAAGTNGSDNGGTFAYNYLSPFGYTGRAFFAKVDFKF